MCPQIGFIDINFRGMLHHVCDVTYNEEMCGPIRTRKCRSTMTCNEKMCGPIRTRKYRGTNWLINYMTIHTLVCISKRKGNQAMIFGQLMKYSMRSIFLQKSCRKWGRGTSSRFSSVFWKRLLFSKSNGQHRRFNIVLYFFI